MFSGAKNGTFFAPENIPYNTVFPTKYRRSPRLCYTVATMVITYHGGQCFKVSFGETTLAFDPIAKKSKLAEVKFGADVAFVSTRHPDFNGIEQVSYGEKVPFVIDHAGEYEVGEVTVRGFGVSGMYDGKPHINTIYQVQFESMNIIFLGALNNPEIEPKILSEFGDIDILFIPIGGGDVLEAPQASKLATKLEARLIIPMHYDAPALKAFLKDQGVEDQKPVDKLTIKKKDVLEMEGNVVVFSN